MKTIFLMIVLISGTALKCSADTWATEPFVFISDVTWNQSGHQVEVVCKKTGNGPDFNYRYDWTAAGNNLENAKVFLTMLLSAQSNAKKFNLHATHGGAAPAWNSFTAISIRNR